MRFQNILSSMMAHLLLQRHLSPAFMSAPPARGQAKRHSKSTLHPRNGNREVARRLRQIAAGQLNRSNGLRTHEEVYGRAAA